MLGIIQEQHPQRCRLFMQWKQMDWPILVDRLNLLEVLAVPITALIDEQGIVRALRPSDEEYRRFLETDYAGPERLQPVQALAPDLALLKEQSGQNVQALRDYAAALLLWGGDSLLGQAISAFTRAVELEPDHGPTHFRLGAAFRARYDSPYRRDADFADAINQWSRALAIDPNQYIWRRRIQQYGPRLDKPYSFYDWVHQAREEILARGETPSPLAVEPGGAEFAFPAKSFETRVAGRGNPDPEGRIFRDEGLIRAEVTLVPKMLSPGETGRVHVVLRPNTERKAHWNNEVEDLVFWIDPPEGWQVDNRYLTVSRPAEAVSLEPRVLEFEIRCPDDATGTVVIPAYSLYYVCEDVNGTCLYRRQDVPVRIEVNNKQ